MRPLASTALLARQGVASPIDWRPRCSLPARMSAADFLLSPEVQKLLQTVLSEPTKQFSVDALSKKTKLVTTDVTGTLEHLVESGILKRHSTGTDEVDLVSVNTSFIFYAELRRIALKSFAAAEPIRKMLRSKFKASVLHVYVLQEDDEANVELLVVHGELVPDQSEMAAACRRLSTSIGRHLTVHVISHSKYLSLTPRDALGAKLLAQSAFEIIGEGGTKAKAPAQRQGLLQSARRRLASLAR